MAGCASCLSGKRPKRNGWVDWEHCAGFGSMAFGLGIFMVLWGGYAACTSEATLVRYASVPHGSVAAQDTHSCARVFRVFCPCLRTLHALASYERAYWYATPANNDAFRPTRLQRSRKRATWHFLFRMHSGTNCISCVVAYKEPDSATITTSAVSL